MAWTVEFVPSAASDLDRLDLKDRHRILSFLYERVARQEDPPRLEARLKGSASVPLWRYRIGRYRIISEIDNEAAVFSLCVSLIAARHIVRHPGRLCWIVCCSARHR